MPSFTVETKIDAPAEKCFRLIRTASETLIESTSDGEVCAGERAVFGSSFLSFKQKLIVEVIDCEKPFRFTDEMIEGAFESFRHVHEFDAHNGKTLLRDTFVWRSPFGIIGKIFDRIFIEKSLRTIVERRNARLQKLVAKK